MNIFNRFFKKKKVKKFTPVADDKTCSDYYQELMNVVGYDGSKIPCKKLVIVLEAGGIPQIYMDVFAKEKDDTSDS
jgi:hypothetical protein